MDFILDDYYALSILVTNLYAVFYAHSHRGKITISMSGLKLMEMPFRNLNFLK